MEMCLMLKVLIYSFSYKKRGVPFSESSHGGGFVFDCRCIPNPGREEQYKSRTGQDPDVVAYLQGLDATENFYESTKSLTLQAIKTYQERGFDSLMICFGCTGGQHRSVYFTERLGAFLKNEEGVEVEIKHRELADIMKNLGRE
ncbi:MAG: RNase adapter RapZ [Bdellovibrionota bacterium]